MTDKHLINSLENCVDECLYGFSKLHSHLVVDLSRKLVFDPNSCDGERIALVSGGGSGHEPFPAGYVGEGMLSASVSGSIFTAPPSNHLLHAIRLVAAKSSGVLLLVPNYTGDLLNFGLAAENALGEGVSVECVVVGDDVAAVGEASASGTGSKAGRRGMCGLVFMFKIIGYLARRGYDLQALKKSALATLKCTASMGLCVAACSKPGVGPLFHLGREETEVGVGVHGEAGFTLRKLLSGQEAVKMLLDAVAPSLGVAAGDEVVALLDNLGSLSLIEEWLLAGELHKQLSRRGIVVARLYAGRFFTSLNMAGVQICVLKLQEDTRDMVLAALDHPTSAPAWPRPLGGPPADSASFSVVTPAAGRTFASPPARLSRDHAELLSQCFASAWKALSAEENRLNHLDSVCGDGDCGTTFAKMSALAQAAAALWDFSDPRYLFFRLSSLMEESVGGTTGALYGLFFKGITKQLEEQDGNVDDAVVFSKCWRAGVEAIKKYTSARPGDRTMLDSLEVGCRAFENGLREEPRSPGRAFRRAVEAASEACENTKTMKALAGRASYTERVPRDVDAGAYAVTVWLEAVQRVLEERQRGATKALEEFI